MSLTPLLVRQFLRPGPYDDSFIYWTVSFLALAFPDRCFLGLSLDVFDIFIGPSFFFLDLVHMMIASSIGPSDFLVQKAGFGFNYFYLNAWQ